MSSGKRSDDFGPGIKSDWRLESNLTICITKPISDGSSVWNAIRFDWSVQKSSLTKPLRRWNRMTRKHLRLSEWDQMHLSDLHGCTRNNDVVLYGSQFRLLSWQTSNWFPVDYGQSDYVSSTNPTSSNRCFCILLHCILLYCIVFFCIVLYYINFDEYECLHKS